MSFYITSKKERLKLFWIKIKCIICGNIFYVYKFRKNTAKFCSNRCRGEYQKTSMLGENNPAWGKVYRKGHHLSTEVKELIRNSLLGHTVSKEAREKISLKNKGRKLSKSTCLKMSRNRKGEKHYNWKGGITPINDRLRRSRKYLDWRNYIKEKYNYTCQKCGSTKKIVSHHIKPFSIFPKLRLNKNNGIALCSHCHKILHKSYAKKNSEYRHKRGI